MSDSKEKQINNEINNISKTIDTILKKIEQEREKFMPASTEDNPSTNQNSSIKDDRKNDPSPSE